MIYIYIYFQPVNTPKPINNPMRPNKKKPKSKGHWDKVPCHIEIDINPIWSDGKCHSGWKLSIDGEEVLCKFFKIELPERAVTLYLTLWKSMLA